MRASDRPRSRTFELLAATVVAAVVVGGVVALIVRGSGTAVERAHPNAFRVQAQELYAPLLIARRSASAAEQIRMRTGPAGVSRHIAACQRPYQAQLSHPPSGTDGAALSALYEHGVILAGAQTRAAPVAPQLAVLARAWADMRLANPTLERFAGALSTELRATLGSPSLDACGFIRTIAIDGFSLASAEQSSYGAIARRFWERTRTARTRVAAFWAYARSARIRARHAWTRQQLRDLANVPGEIS